MLQRENVSASREQIITNRRFAVPRLAGAIMRRVVLLAAVALLWPGVLSAQQYQQFRMAPQFFAGSPLAAGDFNGDGKADFVGLTSTGQIRVALSTGKTFALTDLQYPAALAPLAAAVGDFNGDGKLDIAVASVGAAVAGGANSSVLSILLGTGAAGANGLPTNGLPFQDWGASQCVTSPGLCFADPTHTILQNNEYASVANAIYHGGIVEVKKRFSDRFTLLANYTYSKAIDDSTDFNSDYAAFNEVELAAERSLSDFDQRHKVVIAAVVESPWQKSRVLSGFELSPIVSYNSGHPFNLLAGADINGDNHFTNDRPPGAPRNSGLGPNYATFDIRLSRRLKLGERCDLQFTAESFDLTNRTNYSAVNNVVGADFAPPFDVHGTATHFPSQPLAFTAALPRREVQLGLRLSF